MQKYEVSRITVQNFIYRVYFWMTAALAVTAGTAYYIHYNKELYATFIKNPFVLIGLLLAQVALVIALSGFILRLNYSTALIMFLIYSCVSGITLSVLFETYTTASIGLTFMIAAGMFVSMALYGYFTQTDLSTWGNILLMGLVGLIIGFLINIFLQSTAADLVLSLFGIIIFTGLIAFDMQQLKRIAYTAEYESDLLYRLSLIGALTLYLDLVNLFLNLLRFTGQRRE